MRIFFYISLFLGCTNLNAYTQFEDFTDDHNGKWLAVIKTFEKKDVLKSYQWKPLNQLSNPVQCIRVRMYEGGNKKIDITFKQGSKKPHRLKNAFENKGLGTFGKHRFKSKDQQPVLPFIKFFRHHKVFDHKFQQEILNVCKE